MPASAPHRSTIQLRLLGRPQVQAGGRPVVLNAKALALLTYLAVEGETRRRTLGRLLWPASLDPLNNLAVARTTLNRKLGQDLLQSGSETLALGDPLECDVQAWQQAADTNRWTLWRGTLLEGVSLPEWRDGLGEEFEEWLEQQRERLAAERRDLATRLARSHLAAGNLELALPLLEIACEQSGDPREDATRLLLLGLGASGRPDRASLLYLRLARSLRDDLSVEPTPETRAALNLARQGEEGCREALRAELDSRPQGAGGPTGDLQFVGRPGELAELIAALPPQPGVARLLQLSGEPGAGKTRLAREALARWSLPTLTLRARPSSLPLAPFEAPVRACAQDAAALPPGWRQALAPLVPDLLDHGFPVQEGTDQAARLGALRSLLLAGDGPHVVFLDDAQWLDPTSLEVFTDWLERPPPGGLTLLMTVRTPRTAPGGPERLVRAAGGAGRQWSLAPLDARAVAGLAEQLGSPGVDAETLCHDCGGNPLYIIEFLRGGGGRRPRDLLRGRLDTLTASERQLMEALAVLGGRAAVGEARAVSGRSLEETVHLADQLRDHNLIQLHDAELHLAHDLTREALLAGLSGARLALLHLRAGQWKAADSDPVAAEHYLAAREVWNREDRRDAARTFTQAARLSAWRGDLEGALRWAGHARAASPDEADQVRALSAEAAAFERYGRYAQALDVMEQTEALLEGVDDPVLRAGALVVRAQLLLRVRQDAVQAGRLAAEALAAVTGPGHREALVTRSDALNVAALAAQHRGELEPAAGLYRQALTLRRALRDEVRIAESLGGLGWVQFQQGEAQAETTLLECLRLREACGDTVGVSRTLNNLGTLVLWAGDAERAVAFNRRALALQQDTGNLVDLAYSTENLGNAEFACGRFREATRLFAEAGRLCLEAGVQLPANFSYNHAEACLHAGDFREALDVSDQALASYLAAGAPGRRDVAETRLLRAEIRQRLQQPVLATEELNMALALAEEWPDLQAQVRTKHQEWSEIAGSPPLTSTS